MYDLVVTVSHVLDARTGGNLVAHIKVGETYHQRKEVRPINVDYSGGIGATGRLEVGSKD